MASALAAFLILLAAVAAPAADYTVASAVDTDPSSPGTLRRSIEQANGSGDPSSTIFFNIPGQTVSLVNGLPDITGPLTLTNNSGGTVTVSAVNQATALSASAGLSLGGSAGLTIQAQSAATTAGVTSGATGDDLTFGAFGPNVLVRASSSGDDECAYGAFAVENLTVNGDLAGTVQASASGDGAFAAAMLADTDLTVTGAVTGSVSASATGPTGAAVGLFGGVDLILNGGVASTASITATTSGDTGVATGIYAVCCLDILGGLAGAVSAASTGTYGMAKTIYSDADLTINGGLSGTVTATAGFDAVGLFGYDTIVLDTLSGSVSAVSTTDAGTAFGMMTGTTLSVTGGIASTGAVTATSGGVAVGLYSAGDIAIAGGMAGTVTATANQAGGGAEAYGIFAQGNLDGGGGGAPLAISGTVSATANGPAVAVRSEGTMNISVTGTLSGVDTSGGGNGYAILAAGGDDVVTLGTGASLTGKVDLGAGTNVLHLVGTGTAANQFLNVTNLVAGDGTTATAWALRPSAGNASSFGSLNVTANAALTINEYVTITGDILDNGLLLFDLGGDKTYGGVISGSGAIGKSGTGNLTLTGANSYAGGTTLSGGTLTVSSDGNLGLASGGLTFDGGALRAAADLTTARSVTVNAGGGGFDNNGHAATLGGTFGGSGNFTFSGSGLTTFSGNGAGYSGSATLGSGTLSVSSGAVFGGTGTLAVNAGAAVTGYGALANLTNAGLVSPGANAVGSIGTLTVTGDYVQNATGAYQCDLTPYAGDLLAVSGTATLTGGLNLLPEYTYYDSGTLWTILTATGGLTGEFSSLSYTATPENWIFIPAYTGDSVYVYLKRQPYASDTTTSKAAAVGAGLDVVAYEASGEMTTLLQTLDYSPPGLTDYVLNVLSPAIYGGFTLNLFEAGRTLSAIQLTGINLDAGTTGHGPSAGTRDIGPASLSALSGPDAAITGLSAGDGGAPPETGRLGVFLRPFGVRASQEGSRDRTGYLSLAGGLTGGILYRPSEELLFGLSPAFVTQSVRLFSEGGGTGRILDWSLALLGAWRRGPWRLDGLARVGYDAFSSSRSLPLPIGAYTAKGTWNGYNLNAAVGGGYDFRAGEVVFGPFAAAEWRHGHEDAFSETGAGAMGQSVDKRDTTFLTTTLGGRVARTFETSLGDVTPELRLAWSAQWLDGREGFTASFNDSPGSAYTVKTAGNDYHSAIVDLGVSARLSDRLSASARVGAELFRPGYDAQAASLSLKYSF